MTAQTNLCQILLNVFKASPDEPPLRTLSQVMNSWLVQHGIPILDQNNPETGRSNPFHNSNKQGGPVSLTPRKICVTPYPQPSNSLPPRKCNQMLRIGKISRVDGINDGTGILAGRSNPLKKQSS